ncbi:hypothetical protein GCM10022419_035850 [Nonomuraea rosea]|uniref:Uncharacterized protein n=2 Tax=Nonomuraea rosea TaxID=638574 RepID=A0ABP6WLV4_9ACTN
MPSPPHDALVQMFADRPQLAVDILRDRLGVQLPVTSQIQAEERTFNTRNSDDIEVDLLFTMGPKQDPAHAIIVEAQQGTAKDPKQLARYAAAVWLMLSCDVSVLVVCPDAAAATRYSRPIQSGLTGYLLHAHVLGPHGVPAITDPQEAAAALGLAAMSVMVHGRDRKVSEAFTTALKGVPVEHATKYYEYAYSMAAPEIRRLLEEIMTSTQWPVYSPFAREHFGRGLKEGEARGEAKGEAKGEARVVLLVLAARDLHVPDDIRDRIISCTDLTQLETWATRAATAQSVHDLFDETGEQHP